MTTAGNFAWLEGAGLVELPPDGPAVAVEVARIASRPQRIEQRAEELLDPLHRVVPFEGAWISVLDPERREQPPLISRGHDDSFREYLGGPAGVDEVELVGLSRNRTPVRIQDLSMPLDQVRGWVEYLAPAGFRGAVAVGLFAPDGRYVGVLGLHTDTDIHPTKAARDLIGLLAPMIACAIDPLESIGAVVRIIRDAEAGIVLTRAGNVLPLPGLPIHPLLTPGSPVLTTTAARLASRHVHETFLCPTPSDDDPGGHARITVLACPPQPPHYLTAVVAVSPAGDLRGLTGRELQILGLLIEDWSDERIAAAMHLSPPTVAGDVETILAKLGAPTRIVASLRAIRQGLYVPRSLNTAGT